ncbi:BglG family transcription antiterminator [Sutcliffiella rhizosphaerae]|uniref:PTS system EIIA component n=1 Tax=Sutcliffiella rhizosphaerae TaxID=2880967 RepID=A0ABN8A7V4_9BACI|nr:BglG family transcription antiterminator [Sutcliffiella rhizosphaerae]CAG9621165.1 hypothetical protein BACCIP111883_01937 [Sutcliffiella rhizosphaerae]
MLDQRSSSLLSFLVHAESFVSAKELTERFKISRRTIYYDIDKINAWLKENQLGPVQHVRGTGFILSEDTKAQVPNKMEYVKEWQYGYSLNERKALLALYLLCRNVPLYVEDLMQRLKVSRNTIIDDLKALRVRLSNYHLKIVFERKAGYTIKGNEENKRKAIVYYLSTILPNEGWQTLLAKLPNTNLFHLEELGAIQQMVKEIERDLRIQFTDDFQQHLIFRLILFGKRLTQGKNIVIDEVEKEILRQTNEFHAAVKLSNRLSRLYQMQFPQDEIYYLTRHLLSARVQFKDVDLVDKEDNQTKELSILVSKMVTDFQRYACIYIKDRQQLEKNLLLHVKPSFYRIKYGLEVESDIAALLNTKYPDVFLLTKKVINHLESAVGKPANDNEVALIAMHFGGWMKRTGAALTGRNKILIVCTNGVGTSKLLESQLEGLLPTVDIVGSVSMKEYEENHYNADFIISTIPLQSEDTPVFVVSAILTEAEKKRLIRNIHSHSEEENSYSVDAILSIVDKHANIINRKSLEKEIREYLAKEIRSIGLQEVVQPELKSLLTTDTVKLLDRTDNWETAIQAAAEPLLMNQSITEEYVQTMITNIKQLGPYVVVSPLVAIPHAKPENGVKKLGMSLLRLKHQVPFKGIGPYQIQLIIVLAAADGESHLKALSQLTALLSDEDYKQKIIEADKVETIISLIEEKTAHV